MSPDILQALLQACLSSTNPAERYAALRLFLNYAYRITEKS